MLVLKYHLTESEYFDYNYYTAWGAPEKKGYRVRYYSKVFILYGAVAALYIFTNHSDQIWVDLIIFSVIALVYFLMVPWLIRRSIRRRVKDILRQPENSHILDEAEVSFSETGIVDRDTLSESKYDWEAIVQKAETPDSIYLYTNSHHAIVIPKRVLRHPQDREELERLLSRYLPLSSEFPT